MTGIRRFLARTASLLRTGRAERDLAREINSHLQLLEDQFVEQGMSREDARYAARRTFGGVEQAKERQRDERSFRWLTGWPMDLKLGVRMLAKSPGLTLIAVVALAVAIGAGAAYLEFTRDLISPRLAIAGADRLVGVQVWDAERQQPLAQSRDRGSRWSAVDIGALYEVWRRSDIPFEEFGAVRRLDRRQISAGRAADRIRAVEISASAFRLFSAPALLGRTLTPDDEAPAAPPVAVIGHDIWQTGFDSDPGVIGQTIRVGPVVHTIVGVMPDGFGFPGTENLWTALRLQTAISGRGEGPAIRIFGRLREGVTREAAEAQLNALLSRDGSAAATGGQPTPRVQVLPYVESLMATDVDNNVRAVLYGANLVFVMLLAICGANVATLVFARTAMREAEITVRSALGASRARICTQLFAEALVLSSLAAFAGLVVAWLTGLWARRLFTEATEEPVPFWWNDSLSPETVIYAFLLAVFAALMVGVIPALKATGAQLQGRLREAGAGGATMTFGRLWTGVIVAQAAITVIFLATVVSLGWTSLRGQYSLDVTYPREQLLTARLEPADPTAGAQAPENLSAQTLESIAARLRTEPGVLAVSYASSIPGTTFEQFMIEFPATSEGQALAAEANARRQSSTLWSQGARVGIGFFETLGAPLVSGRLFTDGEILAGRHVAVVDESFVRLVLGGRNPLGVTVRQPAEGDAEAGPWYEIVGVVGDVTRMERKAPDDAMLYRPAGPEAMSSIKLLIRTQGAATPISHGLRERLLSSNPEVRVAGMMSVDKIAEAEALPMRFFLRVFAVVSAIALLLSTAGIYALISFTLARRTREIGIRVALGAAPRRIITGVFSRAFRQIGLGVLAGALPSLVILTSGAEDDAGLSGATGVAATLGVCAFIILVAMIACAAPLRRALRIEPTEALRES